MLFLFVLLSPSCIFIPNLSSAFGVPIFRCPLTSMSSSLHLPLSFSPHGLTVSFLLYFLTYVCHNRPCSYLFVFYLLNPLSIHYPVFMLITPLPSQTRVNILQWFHSFRCIFLLIQMYESNKCAQISYEYCTYKITT